MSESDYVYVRADGVHPKIRLGQARSCVLVLMGVRTDGRKEHIALAEGLRESTESCTDLLRDCRRRGVRAPSSWSVTARWACDGLSRRCFEVPDLLPPALDELGLTFHPAGSVAGQEAAARALAARMLAGELTSCELAFRIHQRFGHELPLAERLANLDDDYDVLEYGGRTQAQVDADVTAEALRLAQRPRVPSEPTDLPT